MALTSSKISEKLLMMMMCRNMKRCKTHNCLFLDGEEASWAGRQT